jgi:hypothetical protein
MAVFEKEIREARNQSSIQKISRSLTKNINVMENQERFYEWMLKMGNIHLASNEKMAKAYEAIAESDAKINDKKVAS